MLKAVALYILVVMLCTSPALATPFLVMAAYDGTIGTYDPVTGVPLSTFGSGGNLKGVHGLARGPNGNIFVSDFDTQRIVEYDSRSLSFVRVFSTTPARNPYSVEFGPDGRLYVAVNGGDIQRFNGTTGAFIDTFIKGDGSRDPGGLTFHNGSLFVTYDEPFNGSLYQYNAATGKQIAKLYGAFSGNGPRTPRFGPDGNLYIPEWQTHHVAKFDGSTFAFLGNIVDDSRISAKSIAFDTDGQLLVLSDDFANGSVTRYDIRTGAYLGTLVGPAGAFHRKSEILMVIPEPSTLALAALGVLGLMIAARRRR